MSKARNSILSVVFFFTCFLNVAQNLIANDDFETYSGCPWNLSMVNLLADWSVPNGHFGSTDYFNACYTTGSAALSPNVPNTGFGHQAAYSGVGYAGIYAYTTNPPTNPVWDYREYLMTPLSSPMVAGVSYYIGFYVSPAEGHKYGSDGIGAHISVGPLSATGGNFQPIPVVPQIVQPAGSVITDTVNWTLISGVYVAAGGENYMTIGNFRSNANTTLQIINPNPILPVQNSYFFVDGAVVEIASLQVTGDDICLGDSVTMQASGSATFAWADSLAPSTILSTNSSLTVSPAVNTTYFVYGDEDTVSYTVNVTSPGFPMMVDLGNDTTLCLGETLLLDASIPAATYQWQDSSSNPTFTVVQAGTYWVTATIGSCTASDTVDVLYVSPPILDLGIDVTLCTGDSLVIDATAPNATYLWQDNSTNATFTVTQAGTYSVVSTVFICPSYDTITVNYIPVVSLDLGPDLSLCVGQTATLDASALGGTYVWQDGTMNPQFQVTQAGQYFVDVTTQCETASDSVNVSYFVPAVDYLGNDTIACLGTSITLSVDIPGAQTQWQDQSLSNTFVVNSSGTFIATSTTTEGCVSSDTIAIDFITIPELDLGADRRVCELDNYPLSNLMDGQGDYLWSSGSQDDVMFINLSGLYFVELSNKCGAVSDTVVINDIGCNCLVYVPNAFTPDGDEHNNSFGAKYDCAFTEFNLLIFNRWGEVIWETNDPAVQWDGTFGGKVVPDGMYVYKLKYSSERVFDEVVTGHFSVVR